MSLVWSDLSDSFTLPLQYQNNKNNHQDNWVDIHKKNIEIPNIEKIKNDLIKFLLNLNIVVSSDEKNENNKEEIKENKTEKKVGRNEKCPCGSGKKYKQCHGA